MHKQRQMCAGNDGIVGNGEMCALGVGLGRWQFHEGSLRCGGIIWSLKMRSKRMKLGFKALFHPLAGGREAERAGGEWSSTARGGVAAAEGAGRRAG
jgi:hypothetical protein